MNPRSDYFSPYNNLYPESQTEYGLENLYKTEVLGITSSVDENSDSLDYQMIEKINKGITKKDGKYHIELPWMEEKLSEVPSNANVCLNVLNRTYKQLKSQNLINEYNQVFQQQLKDGIIEEIVVHPANYENYIWIPHRPIIKKDPQTTTKIRPVFNCSLKTDGNPSLNDAAYSGNSFMNSLLDLLFLFRSEKYVMLSDIKQAFLQIRLKLEDDKNRFCFFWNDNGTLKTYRYQTIIFGHTSSPFLLHQVLKYHAKQYPDDKVTQLLLHNMYVDNFIVSGSDVDELSEIFHVACQRLAEGGFNLRSWISNNADLNALFQVEKKMVSHSCSSEKVLGYYYHVLNDEISLQDYIIDEEAKSKRMILSQISKVYDPLGLCLPVSIRGKIILRDIWLIGIPWDELLPQQIIDEWKSFMIDLNSLKSINFPRKSIQTNGSTNSLFVFCDASKKCYGFVAYIVNKEANFIFAKAKVAPIQGRSLPSLELLSAHLAMNCIQTMLKGYKSYIIKDAFIFLDSQIALSWIVSSQVKVKSIFVRNRIKDISNKKSSISSSGTSIHFNYVPTEENPADLLTRGLSHSAYMERLDFYLHGPSWIIEAPHDWPQNPLHCLSEESKRKILSNMMVDTNLGRNQFEPILDIERFSSLDKLYKITSLVYRFINKLRGKQDCNLKSSKLYWLRYMQSSSFPHEIKFLTSIQNKKQSVPQLVNDLNLFMDDNGLIRSRGRIAKTLAYNYDVLNPILLSKNHHLSKLIIMHVHSKCMHLGLQTTINMLRTTGYWITSARQAVKTVITDCMTCKKYNSIPYRYPRVTDLPQDRVKLVRPFEHTGIDYTGHLFVKDEHTQDLSKVYILLFTCLNIRAIHLELLPSQTTENFLLAFQRFTNLYGIPSSLYSDNAASFKKGDKFLLKSFNSSLFSDHLQTNNIRHVYIPLYSAWVGSTWERLIRVVKNCLYKAIGRSTLTYMQLLTTLSTIKHVINSRPLTYRSSENSFEDITPNSFLNVFGDSNLEYIDPASVFDRPPPSKQDLEETLNIIADIQDKFRTLWHDQYLLSLREQSKLLYQSSWTNRIKVGDVVLIKTPNKTRPFWSLGIVLEVFYGADHAIRSVKLKQTDRKIGVHSICHLYPMELSLTHQTQIDLSSSNTEPSSSKQNCSDSSSKNVKAKQPLNQQLSSERPKRQAALRQRDFMSHNIKNL